MASPPLQTVFQLWRTETHQAESFAAPSQGASLFRPALPESAGGPPPEVAVQPVVPDGEGRTQFRRVQEMVRIPMGKGRRREELGFGAVQILGRPPARNARARVATRSNTCCTAPACAALQYRSRSASHSSSESAFRNNACLRPPEASPAPPRCSISRRCGSGTTEDGCGRAL